MDLLLGAFTGIAAAAWLALRRPRTAFAAWAVLALVRVMFWAVVADRTHEQSVGTLTGTVALGAGGIYQGGHPPAAGGRGRPPAAARQPGKRREGGNRQISGRFRPLRAGSRGLSPDGDPDTAGPADKR